jgi:VWFA-related protein
MDSRLTLAGVIGSAWIATWPTTEGAGRQQPRFTSTTEVVRIYATVQDQNGHLVTDLRQEDFEVRDRGTVVPLVVFSRDAQPLTVAIMADLSGALFDRRTYDVLHEALDAFIDGLGQQDRVSVGWFSGSDVVPGRDLLSDRASIKAAIRTEVTPARANPHFNPAQIAITTGATRRPLWNGVGRAMESLKGVGGRKVVLVLTNGPNTASLRGMPAVREIRAMIPTDEFMVYGVYGFEPRLAEGLIRVDSQAYDYPLDRLTDETGGGFIDVSKERPSARMPLSRGVVAVMAGVANELRQQYTLGFVPTKRDGKVGKIEVTSKRPRTKVWARQSYVAPAE